jgi:UDP-glucuronate 4-epimerase
VKILITGVAGFIGMHVAIRLLARGDEVVGVDNLNEYYDPGLKRARLELLNSHPRFCFLQFGLEEREPCASLFARERPQRVVHLAAQAGVRHSISHPHAYSDANLTAFVNLLEGCRQSRVDHLVFASSSSVYGDRDQAPFREEHAVDHPISLYAATKRANELMAHAYSHLFTMPVTGLRFFTVYGPWGRPDMAFFLFTQAILEGRPIRLFNEGQMVRDFTYVDDIVEGLVRVLDKPAVHSPGATDQPKSPASSKAPFRIFNIGSGRAVPLNHYIEALESAIGIRAVREDWPMQDGDVALTQASTEALERWVGYRPLIPIEVGIPRFVRWYREYFGS